MADIIRIGIDTSKNVFQLHGVDASERPVLRKQVSRREMIRFFEMLPPTNVILEACGASHHWARLLTSYGHEVKLIAPQLAKPYVKRGKNDAADAAALCEAASRPTMRFVPVKTADQQAALMLVGMRNRLIKRRTQLANAIRGHAGEFGVTTAKGMCRLEPLLATIAADESIPALARELFALHADEYAELRGEIERIEEKLMAWHRSDECSQRLAKIPGVGPIRAWQDCKTSPSLETANVTPRELRPTSQTTPNPYDFHKGREEDDIGRDAGRAPSSGSWNRRSPPRPRRPVPKGPYRMHMRSARA